MERPQYEQITFTEETEIPPLPPVKERLKEPQKPDHERDMAEQDEFIKDKRGKKDALIKEKRMIREGGLLGSGNQTRKGELNEKNKIVKGIRDRKREAQNQMRNIEDSIKTLD